MDFLTLNILCFLRTIPERRFSSCPSTFKEKCFPLKRLFCAYYTGRSMPSKMYTAGHFFKLLNISTSFPPETKISKFILVILVPPRGRLNHWSESNPHEKYFYGPISWCIARRKHSIWQDNQIDWKVM